MYSLLLFTYLYTLKLKFFILSFNKILFICFMIISIKNIFHGKVNKKLIELIIIFLIIGIYAVFIPSIFKSYDFSKAKMLFFIVTESCILSFYIIKIFIEKKINLYKLISKVTFYQGIIIVIFYLIPKLRNYILLNIFFFNTNFNLLNPYLNRGIGLSGGGAVFSLIQAIGVWNTFLLYLNKEKINYKLVGAIQLISIILCGRTGIVFLISTTLFYIIFNIKKIKINKKKFNIKNINIYFISLLGIIILFGILIMKNLKIQFLLYHSFENFINLISGNGFTTSSSTHLFKEMLIFPNNLKTLLFGDGWQQIGNGLNYMGTDSGYMQNIYFWGLLGSIFYYGIWIYIFHQLYQRIDHHLKKWLLSLILALFLVEIKEPFLNKIIITNYIFLIFWYWQLKKIRSKKINE